MPLFVVKHQHPPEVCPAGEPKVGPMLAQHVSSVNAEKFGLNLHGEAVVRGGHTLYLILDGADREDVDRFMQPFTQFGTVEVLEASSCEEVVKRGAC